MTTNLLTNDEVISVRMDIMRTVYRALSAGLAAVADQAVRVLSTPTYADRLHDPDHAAIR